ncbi:MAG: SDR family NAD(P)-dependent oxidoreductase, partial [Deltaproteobacteria bacterium]|nr:SDR family NAD(P)-dependent oxidoreductase [Deltaproteobacteria bacterium]
MSDVAIISGGGNGIGRCVALRFAREGIAVAIADADREGADRVVSELTAAGAQARAYSVDVTRAAEIRD